MARELAVVLANGSVQSAVACALAAQKYRVVMLMAETASSVGRAGQAFDALVGHFKPYRSHRLPMPFLAGPRAETRLTHHAGGASSGGDGPRPREEAVGQLVELTPIVAVGMRCAVQYAAAALYLGARVGGGDDAADDERRPGQAVAGEVARLTEFGQLWSEMAQATFERESLELAMPLLELEPWQVVDLGMQVGTPLNLTWSCEQATASEPCGNCRGCRDRARAFTRAGRPDPTRPGTSPTATTTTART